MAIVLYRIDDRLIHGQVVVGWGAHLDLERIAVVDDELAASEWEQDLYRAGLPEAIDGEFVTVEEAIESIPEWQKAKKRWIVLTRDVETMCRIAEAGVLDAQEVNLGGLHEAAGRRRILPYLFLSEGDRQQLRRLRETGVAVTARDVPAARKIQLDELLEPRSR